MMLTLADMGKKKMALYGGPGLADYVYAMRQFMRRCVVLCTFSFASRCACSLPRRAPLPTRFAATTST